MDLGEQGSHWNHGIYQSAAAAGTGLNIVRMTNPRIIVLIVCDHFAFSPSALSTAHAHTLHMTRPVSPIAVIPVFQDDAQQEMST